MLSESPSQHLYALGHSLFGQAELVSGGNYLDERELTKNLEAGLLFLNPACERFLTKKELSMIEGEQILALASNAALFVPASLVSLFLASVPSFCFEQEAVFSAHCAGQAQAGEGVSLSDYLEALSVKKIEELKKAGVIFINPSHSFIAPSVSIKSGTVLFGENFLLGKTNVETGAQIGPNCFIRDSHIGAGSEIRYSQVQEAQIGAQCKVGPYANVRAGTVLAADVWVGNFVEIKNSTLGSATRVSHLSYLGDAKLGEDVNVGAGSITANFNALTGIKSETIISDKVKIGSNSVLVAPVSLAEGSFVAAGTVVSEDVIEPDSLIIGRNRQQIKAGWVREKKAKS